MANPWKTIRGYIWWTYDRGSLHYDVMVTLILLFIFVGPRFIDFKDQPVIPKPHPTGVVVTSPESGGLTFQLDATVVGQAGLKGLEPEFLKIIEPIAGEVTILSYESVTDTKGKITAYKVHARRKYQ